MHRFEREQLKMARPTAFVDARRIRFQDIDAAGIIFYPRLLEMFHDTYVVFMERAGAPLPEVLATGEWLAPVRHAEADYLKPLRFGDPVNVEVCRVHVEPTEVTLGFRVVRTGTDEVCALGQVVHTFVDRRTFKRTPVPAQLLAAFSAIGE